MKEYIVRVYDNRTEWRNKDGNLHREDGPAIEWPDSTKSWWLNGLRHRDDGPAVEYANGEKQWWINGKKLTEEQFLSKTRVQEMTVEEVCKALGKTIKIVK